MAEVQRKIKQANTKVNGFEVNLAVVLILASDRLISLFYISKSDRDRTNESWRGEEKPRSDISLELGGLCGEHGEIPDLPALH